MTCTQNTCLTVWLRSGGMPENRTLRPFGPAYQAGVFYQLNSHPVNLYLVSGSNTPRTPCRGGAVTRRQTRHGQGARIRTGVSRTRSECTTRLCYTLLVAGTRVAPSLSERMKLAWETRTTLPAVVTEGFEPPTRTASTCRSTD